ncbi:DUF5677 domain-containing protein [Amycolatopsis sp. NPDC051758]|uniref:DUF5677 domain-containing protein n=1 Tax=Amycolatopsis sp. NPDC051758 TaxID=3363935 RepID=UPI00379EEB79
MTDARAAYAPILERLLTLYPAYISRSARDTIRPGYRKVAHIAHGWYMRCHRGVEAILLLDDAGYAEEASGIRRSIIEHVVALKWLAAERDHINDTLMRGHARDAERRKDAVTGAGWTSVDPLEIAAVIAGIDLDSRDKSGDHLLHFAQRMTKFGDVHTLPGYLAECSRVHPGYQSAICYVNIPNGGPLPQSRDAVWQVPFAATNLLEAVICIREVFDPPPWGEVLNELGREYREVTDRVREQDGLPAINWSDGP